MIVSYAKFLHPSDTRDFNRWTSISESIQGQIIIQQYKMVTLINHNKSTTAWTGPVRPRKKKKTPANIPSVVRKIPQKSYEVIVACLVEHLLEADDLISSRRNVSLSVLLVMNELSVGVKRASVYEIWVRSRATTLPCPCLLWTDVFLTTARRLFITRVRVR